MFPALNMFFNNILIISLLKSNLNPKLTFFEVTIASQLCNLQQLLPPFVTEICFRKYNSEPSLNHERDI